MNLKWMISALMMSLFFLAACSPSSVEPSVNPSDMTSENSTPAIDTTPAEEEMATPEAPGADFTSGEVPQKMFDAVLADLLTNTGGTRADVTLVKLSKLPGMTALWVARSRASCIRKPSSTAIRSSFPWATSLMIIICRTGATSSFAKIPSHQEYPAAHRRNNQKRPGREGFSLPGF